MLNNLASFSRTLTSCSAALGSVILAAMVGLIALEIVLRNFFSSSTGFTDEFVAYGVSVITFFGLARALETGVLVRVQLLLHAVPSRSRHFLEFIGSFIALLLFGFLTYYVSLIALRDFNLGRTSGSIASTPLWIPEGLLLLGLLIFILRLSVHSLFAARGFVLNETFIDKGPNESEVVHG